MPTISYFYGIKITIQYHDHNPPHFHVKYNEFNAIITIKNLKVLEGYLPRRVLSLVLVWAFIHRFELYKNWKLAIHGLPIQGISPLE